MAEEIASVPAVEHDDEKLARKYGPYAELYSFIDTSVGGLQRGYLRRDSGAIASLAKLRRVAGREPGADPTVWELMNGAPPSLIGKDDSPSKSEHAIHHALTLFALHQQSKGERMHRRGNGIGRGVRRLARSGRASEEAVQRRFQALGTASSVTEVAHHARGLISQLRGAGIPLDYAALAVDLARWQDPKQINTVRLAWGRDYYRAFLPGEEPGGEQHDETETEPEGEDQ